ncbi:MAG: AMP-binding protein [Parvularcula sp.]|nr:AMP-binding protein [Parvularcula sp.]
MKPCIGIVAENSLGYIRGLASVMNGGGIAVPLRSTDDHERIDAALVQEILASTDQGGPLPRFTGQGADPVLINFTSGTEGMPKAIAISAGALADTVRRLIDVSGITDGIREYVGIPVHHSFGFGRCRVLAEVSGAAVLPQRGFDPNELAELLRKGRVDAFSAVPSQIRLLLQQKHIFEAVRDKVRFVEIGSQFMAGDEKRTLRKLFPEASITQHYGLTEASRSTFLRIDRAGDEVLDSVGRAVGATEVRIGEGQRIEIRGPHLAAGKFVRGEIEPLTDADGWLCTSDLGHMCGGYLYFDGRADDLINCGGKKISPEAIEARLSTKHGISGGFALGRMLDAVYGEKVLLVREPGGPPEQVLVQAVAKELAEDGLSGRSLIVFTETNKLPRTPTGKIKRRELSALAPSTSETADPIATLLGADYLTRGVSAVSAEIDSLQTLTLALLLEERVGALPNEWRTTPVVTLLQHSAPREQERTPINDGTSNQNPPGLGYWELIREDFRTNDATLLSYGFWVLFWHRFGNWRMSVKPKTFRAPLTLLYRTMNIVVNVICGVKLDYTVNVGRRVKIEHFGGMMLGARRIGDDVTIRQNTTFGVASLSDLGGKPIIESGVNIGAGAVIAGRITVGRNSIIGPNCVVMEDVPPYSHVKATKPSVRPIIAD